MSIVSRSFRPVTLLPGGQCPNDEWHFQGAAREVYSYLKLLAARHGGFVFPSVDDIVRHTRQWSRGQKNFSKPQCERILRIFRELSILGDYETRVIHGRSYRGWQFGPHKFWSCIRIGSDKCEFEMWELYEGKSYMGNKHKQNQKDAIGNDGLNDGQNDGDLGQNDGQNDGGQTIVSTVNPVIAMGVAAS